MDLLRGEYWLLLLQCNVGFRQPTPIRESNLGISHFINEPTCQSAFAKLGSLIEQGCPFVVQV